MQNFYLSASKVWENTELWKSNSENKYMETIRNIIEQDPYKGHKFYIFSFWKRVDDDTGVKVMYHQARMTQPEPLPGTTLMRVDPKEPDAVTIVWTLPNQENFGLYKHGKMFADKFVFECIEKYQINPSLLNVKFDDDLSDHEIREIYKTKMGSKPLEVSSLPISSS